MMQLGWAKQPFDWSRHCQNLAQAAAEAAPALQRYYEAALPPPSQSLAELPLVALDLETTGLNPERDAIVSVGLIPFDLQRIRCREARYWVLKPDVPLAAKSVTLHRITDSAVAEAPPLSQVLVHLLEALAGRVVVVHYRAIERQFLDRAAQRLLGARWQFPVIDTLQLEARFERSAWRRWQRWWQGEGSISLRLADARRRYGLPAYHAHHALTDALATAELLQAQMAHHFDPQAPVAKYWC